MKKVIYVLILSLVVVSGLVYANRGIKNEAPKKSTPTPTDDAEKREARKQWEATPEGIKYKKWQASPEGEKVLASAAKISRPISDSTGMEAVVTALSLPPGSRLGFGVMVQINDEDYILSFWALQSDEFQQLHSLKVNDRILIKNSAVSHAPKYSYPIITGNHVERDSQIIYKRPPQKGGC